MDIYALYANATNVSYGEAKRTVNVLFHTGGGFEHHQVVSPADKFKSKKKSNDVELNILNNDVMNRYYPMANDLWVNEGIDASTQKKFNIRYSIEENAIIVPHYLYDGSLVGVRKRNLNQDEIDAGKKYIPVFQDDKFLKYPVHENLFGLYQNQQSIADSRVIVLFEAEKSVMMMDSFFGGQGYSVALSGSYLSDTQLKMISKMPVNEVIVGLDKEYSVGDSTEDMRRRMLEKQFGKLTTRFSVSVLWDKEDLLDEKDSPTDKGKDVFEKLMRERLFL